MIDLDKLERDREAACEDKADLFDFYHENWSSLIDALHERQAGRLTPLQEKLAFLDAALTRKKWATVTHTAMNRKPGIDMVTGGGDRAYYLSDGGYSRICADETGHIVLTSNSRQEVKEAWVHCRELIADVEAELRRLLKDAGWETV